MKSAIVAVVEKELEQLEFEEVPVFTVADVVKRVSAKHPNLDSNQLQEIASRVCKRRYNDWTDEEREAQLDARDEAIRRQCALLLKTEGKAAAEAYLNAQIARYEQEAQALNRESAVMRKGSTLLQRYHAHTMADLPRQAWEEYTEYAVSLGFRREDILNQWSRKLRKV